MFIVDFLHTQSFGVGQPRRIENAKILIANTPMDTDKIKIYGSRVRWNVISILVFLVFLLIERKVLCVH